MIKSFSASLCQNGIIGGYLYVHSQSVSYRTAQLFVPNEIRNLEIPFGEIAEVSKGR